MALSIKQIAGDEAVHYIPPRKRRKPPKPKMQPRLTPMIDVTFQLLFFFLMATQFREGEGQIPGTLPQEAGVAQGRAIDIEPLKVGLIPDGEHRERVVYEINRTPIRGGAQELYAILRQHQAAIESEENIVVIKPRGDVRWEFVVEAYNQAVRAEYSKIAFAPAG